MTVTAKDSGSQTATLTTEHTLSTITDAGTYIVSVDVANMALGDETYIKIYGKARSSDTERLVYSFPLANVPVYGLFTSLPYSTPHYMKITLTQEIGTGRAYPWAAYQLDG